jgi:hypothetical protein
MDHHPRTVLSSTVDVWFHKYNQRSSMHIQINERKQSTGILSSLPHTHISQAAGRYTKRERERERERAHKPLCWSALVSRPAWHASPLSLSKHEYLASLFLPQHLRGQDNDNQMLSAAVTRSVQPLGSGIKWLA